jgi:hypothetical protein
MIKSCTIVPTHPSKFKWAYSLLDSYLEFVNQPHDLYFIFTSESDADEFKKYSKNPNSYKELILSQPLRNKKSIINVKKYFGLFCLKSEYDYIGVFDCESKFVKKCNLDEIYYDVASKKYFKANEATDGSNIIKHIAETLKLNYNKNLLNQTNYYSVYWWFNEVPVYDMKYFSEFINWFYNLENIDEIQNDYYCFDFLVYSIWLICFKNFKIKTYKTSIKFGCGAVEEFRENDINKDEISKLFDSYWSTNFNNHINYEKIKILFQVDNIDNPI